MWPCLIWVFLVMLCERLRRPACDFRMGRTTKLLQSVWHQLESASGPSAVPGVSGVAAVGRGARHAGGVVSNPWEDGCFFPSLLC